MTRERSKNKGLVWIRILAILPMLAGCADHRSQVALPVAPNFHYPESGFTIEESPKVVRCNLSGQVLDPIGNPVANALVEIREIQNHSRLTASFTSQSGVFNFSKLPVGSLELKITKPYFSPSLTPLSIERSAPHSRLKIQLRPAV